MAVRHKSLRNETVQTMYGPVDLDEYGRVKNPENLPGDVKILLTHPDFLDDNLFDPLGDGQKDAAILATNQKGTEMKTAAQLEVEKKTKQLLKDLAANPENLNSANVLDLKKANAALHAAGLPSITGAERDALMA